MGRGEYTGLVIALIIFGVLWVLLAVTTAIFFNKFNEMEQKYRTSESARLTADNTANQLRQDIDRLKLIIGSEPATPVTQIQQEVFQQDMERYGAALSRPGSLDPSEWSYRNMLRELEASVLAAQSDFLQQKTASEDVSDALALAEAAAAKKVADANAARATAENNLNQEKTKHTTALNELRQGYDARLGQLQQTIAQLNKDKENLITDKGRAESQLAQARGQIAELSQQLAQFRGETPTAPDGAITLVDNRTGNVYINLGSADGLPERQTFSVYVPATETVTADTVKKGTIEVTRILGDHLAQARITDSDVLDPLRVGDKVHTPVWKPGSQQIFAMAGFLDIDDDGKADNSAIRLMVERAGGKISAEVTPQGELSGELSGDTHYLILGEMTGAAAAPLATASNDLESAASRRGVRSISLEQFLDMSGYRRGSRVYQPGSGQDYNLRQGQRNR